MIARDTAQSSLASHTPDIAAEVDSLYDFLREKIAACRMPIPRTAEERNVQFCELLEAAVREMDGDGAAVSSPRQADLARDRIVMETLLKVFGDTRHADEIESLALAAVMVVARTGVLDRDRIVLETLRAVYGDTRHALEIRVIAKSALIVLGRTGESYQEAADEFAVTRACPHLHARQIEKRTGIRPRRAKTDRARAQSAENAKGTRNRVARCSVRTNVLADFPGLS